MSCSWLRLLQHAQWQRLPLRGAPIISVTSKINVSAVLYSDAWRDGSGKELEAASDRWTLDGHTNLFDSVHLRFGCFWIGQRVQRRKVEADQESKRLLRHLGLSRVP